ncbi:MAG: GNAT family N-acetyltransferase [Nocardioidaceae bacterium]
MSDEDLYSSSGDRTPLYDESGQLALIVTLTDDLRSGRPCADGAWRPRGVAAADAGRLAQEALRGYALATSDRELVECLIRDGADLLRSTHTMSHDLAGIEMLRSGASEELRTHRLTRPQLLRHAARIGTLMVTAYPPGHPDHRFTTVEHAVRSLHLVAEDEVLGPFLDVSQVAVLDHTVVGAALVVNRSGTAPDGGPWVLDIFRDPTSPAKGVGRALLLAVLTAARQAGLTSLALVVSTSNVNAVGLYQSLGFVKHEQSWTLALP